MSGWLFVHILGVVMLVGNALTAAFWKIRADREEDMGHSLRVAKNIMVADYLFTLPSIVMILWSGHVLAAESGYSVFEWSWLGVSYGLFALSGVLWMAALLPAQVKMIRQAERSLREGRWTAEYRRASAAWNAYGIAATLAPLAAMVLMVWKPDW
ncbi:DUF2269 family protein [Gorillibacterium sp. sgz5001074]|uniref:DUF2269 family protein n=1 Tax=Gorillibacterium sp. sgz5001074 TaxID=3446695 RepID=UPI003F66D684